MTSTSDAPPRSPFIRPFTKVGTRAGDGRAWLVLLMATPFLAAAYLLLPTDGSLRAIAYPVYSIVATLAVVLSLHSAAPETRGPWRLVALAIGLIALGDITYSVLALNTVELSYPSSADVLYLSGYLVLIAGASGLTRRAGDGAERGPLLDAAILASGALALLWVVLMEPSVRGATDPLTIGVSLAYPAMDIVLLWIGLRTMLGNRRPRYLQFLLGGIALYFAASLVYGKLLLEGSYAIGQPVDAGWIVGVLLIGVAALHPSAREPVAATRRRDAALSRSRLAMLAAAAMLVPALIVRQGGDVSGPVVMGLVICWVLVFGLVFLRLATMLDELRASLLQRRRLQDDLVHEATHDPLTRIANRALFQRRLDAALNADAAGTALIFMDLDDFKGINDTLGHVTGDEFLRAIAARIERVIRTSDLVARLGGDEFAVLVAAGTTPESVRAMAERVLAAVRQPVAIGGHWVTAHASAGIAFGREGATAMDLMRDADVAMYQAKSKGKDQAEEHRPEMHDAIVRSFQLRRELAAAIESRAFYLDFQPVIELGSGAIVGAEALVRWQHPEHGRIPPLEFIGLAESTGEIHALGRWILREACRVAATWPADGDGRKPFVTVNVASSQLLGADLAAQVTDALRDAGLDAGRLVLEVTESSVLDIPGARTSLQVLSRQGVLLALDDFGSGYSALNYLTDLPFDIVKVDRSLVANVPDSASATALLEGILRLCGSLRLTTLVEGIERDAQADGLRRSGCQYGQGFLFGRPMRAALLETLLEPTSAAAPANRKAAPSDVDSARAWPLGMHGGGIPAAGRASVLR